MTSPQWYINEIAFAGSEHLDAEYVTSYDQKAGNDPQDDLNLLRDLGLNQTHTLIDLGAGTGTFALAAAPYCKRVVAVDVSPVMLTSMKTKCAEATVENVECVHAGFLSYDHQGEPADFVYSRHALHHLPDFFKALALQRIAAMTKPGSVLFIRDLIYSFEPQEMDQHIEGWLAGAAESAAKGWTRAELETHIREEFSPFSWVLEPMIRYAGFDIQQINHTDSRIYSTYICSKR